MDIFDKQFKSLRNNMQSMEKNIIDKITGYINDKLKDISKNKNELKISRQDISKIFSKDELIENMYQQFSSSMYLNNSNYSFSEKKFDYGTYEGEFRGDKIEGKGTFYYKDGYTYEGEFKNEKIEGKGILSNNKDYKYKGEFKNGKMEGKGKEYYENGDIYEGDFKNGLKEGKGIYYYNSGKYKGDRYEGDWKNDKKDGNGIYYYHDGKREMGDYSNGNRIGKHVSLYKDGKVDYKIY
jgi:hypothetical protein